MMKFYRVDIEYDGTEFYGWQRQNNDQLRTVQGEIEKVLLKILKEKVKIHGSGRTDRGVHANGQVATFRAKSTIPGNRLKYAMNSFLPKDIFIKFSEEISEDFHARYSAKGKEYKYLLYCAADRSPLMDRYYGHTKLEIDFELMKQAALKIEGKHDFRAFMASGSSVNNTIREIHELKLEKKDSKIIMTIRGNGFLYNMVRIIMGTLVEISCGRKNIAVIETAYITGDRDILGFTATARGLYLQKVFYN